LSRQEREALAPALTAANAQDWAAAQAALPAAQAAAQGADAKYIVGQIQLRIGVGTQNPQLQAQAIEAMLASGGAQPDELRPLLTNQAALAANAGDLEKAQRAIARLVELNPDDHEVVARLAEINNDRNNKPEAVRLYQRALELQEANGQHAPENWYRRALAVAYEARLAEPTIALSQRLVSAYPSPTNWRDAMLIYLENARVEESVNIDAMRLMRVAQALNGERDYVEFAGMLNRAGLPGEVKAVLDEGIARGMLEASRPAVRELMTGATGRIAEDRASLAGLRTRALAAGTGREARGTAEAYLGYGQHAEAAELYRAALQKGGVDNDLVNTRLGIALALAGQRAEAEAAFRAVGGQRQQLARFWLAWLENRAG
jgi:hypothetical protein